MFPIPKDLEHFTSVFEVMESSDDEFESETILTQLETSLRSIYCGLSAVTAEEKFESDITNLSILCENHGDEHTWLYLLQGFLSPHILQDLCNEEFSKYTPDELPPLTLAIELPPESELNEEFGSIRATFGDILLYMYPTDESVLSFKLNNVKSWNHYHNAPEISTVDWGSVTGTKISTVYSSPTIHENVTYLLKVPGGAAVVEVESPNSILDAATVEQCLQSITVTTNSPQ